MQASHDASRIEDDTAAIVQFGRDWNHAATTQDFEAIAAMSWPVDRWTGQDLTRSGSFSEQSLIISSIVEDQDWVIPDGPDAGLRPGDAGNIYTVQYQSGGLTEELHVVVIDDRALWFPIGVRSSIF